jgi:anti-anti-sigma factor
MNINVTERTGRVPVTILHVQGDIDTNSHTAFEQRAQDAIRQGAQHVLIDLQDVGYISSAGIRALNALFQSLRSRSPESDAALYQGVRSGTYKSPHLKLLNPQPAVLNVLSATGLDMLLEIHHDLDTAVASF